MLYFWRDRDREVDFLIHCGGRFELLEAKWSKTPTLDDTQQITRFEKMFGHEAVISAEIICRCEQSFALTPGRGEKAYQDNPACRYPRRCGEGWRRRA